MTPKFQLPVKRIDTGKILIKKFNTKKQLGTWLKRCSYLYELGDTILLNDEAKK